MQPEVLADTPCVTGENPLWHPEERRVYWVDIPSAKLYRCDPAGGAFEVFDMGAPVGGITLQEDGALLCFMGRGAVKVWREGFVRTVLDDIPDERDNRFNDVIADPAGRVFCGTMTAPSHAARLYRLDPGGALTQLQDGIGTSNGLGFSPDRKQLYYTDTRPREIYRFDYDRATGGIANRCVFVHVPDSEGKPDGMTVDAEGCVWSAQWDGNCMVRYSPAGEVLTRVEFPTRKISCVTFGGSDYTDMYVTTAGGDDRDANGATAGSLYHVNLGVRGVPEFRSRL